MELPPRTHVPATPALDGVDIRSLYRLDTAELLGKGGFSQVVAAAYIPTGEVRALKIMERQILTGKKGEMVAHEKEILRRTNHPNIITLHQCLQDAERVYFALDLMSEDLFEFVVRNKWVNETLARKIMHALMSGILYLHEQSIVHRDIKPENILINTYYNNSGAGGEEVTEDVLQSIASINELNPDNVEVEVKIADFGLAKLVMEWDIQSTPCGTSFYIAPEVIRGIEEQGARPLCTNSQKVKSIDVWSAGVVLFVLLSGRPPFHGQVKTAEERRALLRRIDRGVLFSAQHGWEGKSEEVKDLILGMLEQDTARRLTAAQVLQHPFFTRHGFPKPVPGRAVQQQQRRQQEIIDRQNNNNNKADDAGHHHGEAGVDEEEMKSYGSGAGGVTATGSGGSGNSGHRRGGSGGNNFFTSMKHFFSGGSGSARGGNGNGNGNGANSPSGGKAGKNEREMGQELAALQQDLRAAGDEEGEETAYKGAPTVRDSRPAKPAVMNSKAKIGPAALKK